MKKVFLFILCCVFCCTALSAQDILYMKNGSVLKGTVLEQTPGVSLKFQTRDGSVYVYNMSEIERITREQKEQDETPSYDGDDYLQRGFRGLVDFGGHFGFGDAKDCYQVSGAFTGGYQINRMIFVGGGIAPTAHLYKDYYDDLKAQFILPIYTAGRFDFINNKITPFAEARIGYYINTDYTDASDLYMYYGAGVRLNKLSLSAGYTYYGNGDYPIGFIGLRVGFEF